jgi:hypothetical protein
MPGEWGDLYLLHQIVLRLFLHGTKVFNTAYHTAFGPYNIDVQIFHEDILVAEGQLNPFMKGFHSSIRQGLAESNRRW